jgi:glutaredoxin-dependent peroxiredoxin
MSDRTGADAWRMSRLSVAVLLSVLFIGSTIITVSQPNHEAKPMSATVGSKAPAFSLFDTDRKQRTLAEFAGKKVVLAFYPGAFTGVCTKEMCAFRDAMAAFNGLNAQVVGISVDASFANKAFADANKLTFPLLSDFTRETSKAYAGVYEDFAGLQGYSASKRAVFVVDEKGVITYVWVAEAPGNEPPYEEVKAAVK